MHVKKMAVTAVTTVGLGFAALGFGAGTAQADDWHHWDPVPPPGQIGQWVGIPPGQIAKLPFVPPPGHWDKPWKWVH